MNRRSTLAVSLALLAGVTIASAQLRRYAHRDVTPASQQDTVFTRSISVGGTPTVSVSTTSGYIHIHAGQDGQAQITGHLRINQGWSGGDADARVRQILAAPPVAQAGSTITIGPASSQSDLYRNISIDYDLTLPRSTVLKARTGSGEIEIGGILGAVSAETGSGAIHADGLGPNARLFTALGPIRAVNVRGSIQIESGSGDLELAQTGPGDVRAQTGTGSIRIGGIAGGLRADSGSGAIEVAGSPMAEWRLQTGSGAVRLNLPASARFNLNAETGSGTVEVELPIVMQGALNKHHVTGSVNGGGPVLRVTTGSGSITIR